jgi:hypothetical protein
MSRDSLEAVRKAESTRDSLGTVEMDRAVAKIMKAEPNLNKHEAIRKLMTSEEGARLYGEYDYQQRDLLRKLDPSRDYPGNGSGSAGDADDGDDEDDDDGKEKRKCKAKAGKAKCKSEDDDMEDAIDGDDDEDDEDDDKEKRRKSIAIGKTLHTGSLVLIRKADATFTKLCQKCTAENKISATKCGDCGQGFAKLGM